MATHVYPESGERLDASAAYLASPAHSVAAGIGLDLLRRIPNIEVRDIQFPKDRKYTCWYVSVPGHPKKPILNFGLFPSGSMTVEFRYMQFVPARHSGPAPVAEPELALYAGRGMRLPVDQVEQKVRDYVLQCREALGAGVLRRGGTSAAESVLRDVFVLLKVDVVEGERPEWLRNPAGNPLCQCD